MWLSSLMLSQNIWLYCAHLSLLGMVQADEGLHGFPLVCLHACITPLPMRAEWKTSGTTEEARGRQCGHAEPGDDSHPTQDVTGQRETLSHYSERRLFGNLRLGFPGTSHVMFASHGWPQQLTPEVKGDCCELLDPNNTEEGVGWGRSARKWEQRETQICVRE